MQWSWHRMINSSVCAAKEMKEDCSINEGKTTRERERRLVTRERDEMRTAVAHGGSCSLEVKTQVMAECVALAIDQGEEEELPEDIQCASIPSGFKLWVNVAECLL